MNDLYNDSEYYIKKYPEMKERIYSIIRDHDNITFVELMFFVGDESIGDNSIKLTEEYNNIIIWAGICDNFAKAIMELKFAGEIHFIICKHYSHGIPVLYLLDHMLLNLPIAKSAKKYDTLHWLPVTISTHTDDSL